jgi:methionyl-tRNA formyltransferase
MISLMYWILFLGQEKLGEKCFEILHRSQTGSVQICGAVSNMESNVWWKSNGIYDHCQREKIPFIDNREQHDDEIRQIIRDQGINTILSIQHPWTLPEDTLAQVDGRAFQVHNAKLPDYRGYNGSSHAILNREPVYGATIHWMTGTEDLGDIVTENAVFVDAKETARSLYDKATMTGINAFRELLRWMLIDSPIPRKPMDGEGTYYSRDSLDAFRKIDDPADAEEVDRKARAMYFPPFEPAYFVASGKKHYVLPERFITYAQEFDPTYQVSWSRPRPKPKVTTPAPVKP